MRWEHLFDDLESQFEALADAQLRAELADRERVAVGAVTLAARLAGAVGEQVRLHLMGGGSSAGLVRRVGPNWVLVAEAPGREALVASSAVTMIDGLVQRTGSAPSGVSMKLDLRYMLRGVVRDRSPVVMALQSHRSTGGPLEVAGTLDRVGADFVEIALHAAWESRRAGAVRSVATVPISAVAVVRAVPLG